MAFGYLKDFPKRTNSDKLLYNKAFIIAKNPKYDGYQGGLVSMVYKFFDKKVSATRANKFAGSGVNCEIRSNNSILRTS